MCSIPDHRARTGTPHDVTSDPDPSRPHGPGFTGFGPATVASTVRSHVALSAARLLSATDVTCLTDDECLGVFDDLEAVQRSLDAIGAMVVSEIDGRDLCDTRYGISTRVWFERRHGRSRGTIGRQASAGRKLRRDLPQIAHALARGEITGERAMYVVSKLNVRNTDALAAAQQGLLALSESEPSFAQFCVLVNDLARFADADGSDEPSAATNSARVHRVNDEVAVSATYVDADGESFEQLVEAAAKHPDPGRGAARARPQGCSGGSHQRPTDRDRVVAGRRRRPGRRAQPDPRGRDGRNGAPRRPRSPTPLRRPRPLLLRPRRPRRRTRDQPRRPTCDRVGAPVGAAGVQRLGLGGAARRFGHAGRRARPAPTPQRGHASGARRPRRRVRVPGL